MTSTWIRALSAWSQSERLEEGCAEVPSHSFDALLEDGFGMDREAFFGALLEDDFNMDTSSLCVESK